MSVMGGFLGGWFGGSVRRMVPAYHLPMFDGEDARAVQSPRRRCAGDLCVPAAYTQEDDATNLVSNTNNLIMR